MTKKVHRRTLLRYIFSVLSEPLLVEGVNLYLYVQVHGQVINLKPKMHASFRTSFCKKKSLNYKAPKS